MKYGLSLPSLHRRANYFSLFLRDIISIVIINEKQPPEFGKLLMVLIIQRADSPCVPRSLVIVWKCSGEIGTVGAEAEDVCVALPSRVCTHRSNLALPNGLSFHAEVFLD